MESQPVLVPLVGLLASGLAAFALVPRSVAARALIAAGVLLVGSWFLEDAALDRVGVLGVVLRVTSDGLFLGGLAAIVALLATYPESHFERGWTRALVAALAGAAVLGSLARLLGEERVSVGSDPDTAIGNGSAVDGMAWLGAAGAAVIASEPVWLLLGIGTLLLRWRGAAGPLRHDLTRLLVSLALLAGLLVLIGIGELTGVRLPEPASTALFLIALTMLPLELLRGITSRARALERDLAASRARIIGAEDQTRRRIERDLHDGAQQHLVAILSLTELASHQSKAGSHQVGETLLDVCGLATKAIADLREVVHGIRPPALQDSGIAAALESRFERLPALLSTDFGSVREARFSDEVEATVYFVACEAVTNALKYAAESPVQVRLVAEGSTLSVTVRDEGPGLPEPPYDHRGSGLPGLRDRVESLGGEFLVRSEPGSGCVVTAVLPAERLP